MRLSSERDTWAGYAFERDAVQWAIAPRTRLPLVNTPGDPSGGVLRREELADIAQVCDMFGMIAITDEICEQPWYGEHRHVSLASLPGMAVAFDELDNPIWPGGMLATPEQLGLNNLRLRRLAWDPYVSFAVVE